MKISERQIMQLIEIVRQYQAVLLLSSGGDNVQNQYNCAAELLNAISNQQSEKLKAIE